MKSHTSRRIASEKLELQEISVNCIQERCLVSTTLFLVVSLKNSDRAVRKFFWLTSSILEQKVTLAPMPLINLLPNTISSTVNTYPPTAVLSMPRHDSPPAPTNPTAKAPFSCSKVPIRRYDDASSINQAAVH